MTKRTTPEGWRHVATSFSAGLLLLLSTCGQPAPQATKAPVTALKSPPWIPGGIPGILSDLESFAERPDLSPTVRAAALFRLAALHEERARADSVSSGDPSAGLVKPIALYKRIIHEFPDSTFVPWVYYFLGHALTDSNRLPEAQQVFRSFVCHNHYAYPVPPDPKDPARDSVKALPQDHDSAYWSDWALRRSKPGGIAEEPRFISPFPDDCQPLSRPSPAPSRAVAEIWWRIGDYYLQELDPAAGPYSYGRAEAAYGHALRDQIPPVYGVALYKLAWTYFKQQRYETAVWEFVDLLRYIESEQSRTGDPGTDLRLEACAYIAGSLTYVDFKGPPANDPYIPRGDVLDLEPDSRVAEQKMHIAIDRVQDAGLIPQNEKWTVEIYMALAREFKELAQFHNMIDVYRLILRKWPLYRDAPAVQAQIADGYLILARSSHNDSVKAAEYLKLESAERSKLSAYVGSTPWVEANKKDAEAIEKAKRLAAPPGKR